MKLDPQGKQARLMLTYSNLSVAETRRMQLLGAPIVGFAALAGLSASKWRFALTAIAILFFSIGYSIAYCAAFAWFKKVFPGAPHWRFYVLAVLGQAIAIVAIGYVASRI